MGDENKKKEGKKSNKKIIITVIIIVLLVFIAIGGFIFYHVNQTNKLVAEVNKIANIEVTNEDGTLKENPIDMEIKTTGSYAVIEKTFKDYVNEVVVLTQELGDALNQDELTKLVSFDNIKEDGPDFVNSKEKVNSMRQAIEQYMSKMQELANGENLLSQIDDKDVSDYYKELYKSLAVDEESGKGMEEAVQALNESGEEAKQALDDLNSIFNFLSENKDEWEIEGDQIVFTTQSAYDEYTNLMSTLETMK